MHIESLNLSKGVGLFSLKTHGVHPNDGNEGPGQAHVTWTMCMNERPTICIVCKINCFCTNLNQIFNNLSDFLNHRL